MTDNHKKIKQILLIVSFLVILIIGTVVAFLTDAESKSNIVTLGNIGLKLTEENFPDEPPTITPGSVIEKDPVLSSTGSHDEYVFLEVTIPKYEVTLLYEQNEYELDTMLAESGYTLHSYTNGTDTNFLICDNSGTDAVYYEADTTYDGNYIMTDSIVNPENFALSAVGNLKLHYEGEKKTAKSYQEIFRTIADDTTLSERVINNGIPTEFAYNSGDDTDEGWVYLGLAKDNNVSRTYVFGYNTKLDAIKNMNQRM